LQKVFSTQLNLNINFSVFLFKTPLGTSEPVKDWQALTTYINALCLKQFDK